MHAYLKKQIEDMTREINTVCDRIGRDAKEITLVGVTKTYESDVINAAIEYGLTVIAENRVQEIIRKYDSVASEVSWHLIGHLQTNKVKYIIDKVDLIQSLDSERLADEIQTRAEKINKIQSVLIQVNVADETQKSGISPSALPDLISHILSKPNIRICGLMNIAPDTSDKERLRNNFKVMKQLFDALDEYASNQVEAKYLSMGMSSDFEIALEEGANMIRIGTRIFGRRQTI